MTPILTIHSATFAGADLTKEFQSLVSSSNGTLSLNTDFPDWQRTYN
jgi:hypothetical protein